MDGRVNIEQNTAALLAEIGEICRRCRRDPSEVRLLAATKTRSAAEIARAAAAGITLAGENRVQEMQKKLSEGAYAGLELHFIGGLQTNKAKDVTGTVSLIHSVDSERLLTALSRAAEKKGIVQDILLEINIGGEPGKHGFPPESLDGMIELSAALGGVRLRGLMAVPPAGDAEQARPYFAEMNRLFLRYKTIIPLFDTLSMGMSGDYSSAIQEGSTLVRVGSLIFGERVYTPAP